MVWSNISTFLDMASARRILKYTTQIHTHTHPHQLKLALFQFYFSAFGRFHFIHSMASCRQYISLPLSFFFILVVACTRFSNANEKSFCNELEKRNTQTSAWRFIFWDPPPPHNTVTADSKILRTVLRALEMSKWMFWWGRGEVKILRTCRFLCISSIYIISATALNKYLHWKLIHCEWNIFVGNKRTIYSFSSFPWLLSVTTFDECKMKTFCICRFFSNLTLVFYINIQFHGELLRVFDKSSNKNVGVNET